MQSHIVLSMVQPKTLNYAERKTSMTTTKRIILTIFVICITALNITVESRWMAIVATVIFLVLLFSPLGEKRNDSRDAGNEHRGSGAV